MKLGKTVPTELFFFQFCDTRKLGFISSGPSVQRFNEPNRSRVAPLTEMLNDLHDNGPPEESQP